MNRLQTTRHSFTFPVLLIVLTAAMPSPARAAETAASGGEALAAEFAQPGPEYRGKPFWSWNGELREDELFRQIGVLKDMGMSGYFMHSRTGLATEYLGDEWFKLINDCADEGARQGLDSWLYDEDRWPSGTAGGLVTVHPEFRQKYLSMQKLAPADFTWNDGIVAAFACNLDDLDVTDCKRLDANTSAAALDGKTILVFSLETAQPSSFFNGNTDVDRLCRAATDEFIRLTHEQYKAHCGDRLGKTIPGIFTDEPHRGVVFSTFSVSNPNALQMTTWTDKLPEVFQQRFGYDILDHLPELFLHPDGQTVAPVKWQYMETLQTLFLENWCKPIREWCDREKMQFTGHFLHEDSLTSQAVVHGSLMRGYETQHLPGVDVLTEGNRNYWIVKQLSSAARQLGQQKLLSELYGCTGWQFNFESHKAVGLWQALFGINLRCHHLSWYTMAGEAKRDYPASIFFQSGWWRNYRFVEDYFARVNTLLAQGKPACDVLVLNPIESVWSQVGVGWADGLSAKAKDIRALEKAYSDLFFFLAGSHIDFDYGDEEMFGRLCHVDRDGDTPVLRFGQADYRAVVVPKMTTIRSTSLKLLEDFLNAGGKVIFAGDAPAYVDVVTSNAPADLAAKATKVPWKRDALADALQPALRVPIEIVNAKGDSVEDIFCQVRDTGTEKILVAINTSPKADRLGVTLRIKADGAVSEWNCLTGERTAVDAAAKDGWLEFTADFPPSGDHAYMISKAPLPGIVPAVKLTEDSHQVCDGPFDYTLNEPNVCVLDIADYQIDTNPVQTDTEILKIDRAVRAAFGLPLRGGEMVQPWYSKKFAAKPEVKGKLSIVFHFNVDTKPSEPVQLALEEPGNYTITLNGHPLDATITGWWVDPAIQTFSIPPDKFIAGDNHIELRTGFREDMNLEAIYLLGKFGVTLDGIAKSLTTLPEKLAPTDLTAQGLPFYSGAIAYKIPVTIPVASGQRLFLATPKFEAACIKAVPDKIIPWPPYEADITGLVSNGGVLEVQAILTRRNTFGPLHQVPLRADAYGPGNWTTEGAGWTQNYQLYPAGLLASPILSLRH